MTEERKLEKQGKEYVLTVEDSDNRSTQIKRYTREEMFENYDLVASTIAQLKGAIHTTKNQIKNLGKIKETDELKKFAQLLEDSQKLRKKRELEQQLKSQEENLEKTKAQEREITRTIPEVLRRDKK